jgi:Lhr-like helicase
MPRSACRGRPHGPSRGPEVYNIIRQHKTSIVFVNTRAQAELVFDRLWRINEENLAIGLHHGSLAVEQRRKVEAAMAAASCAPWWRPPRSISASTGATSTW